MERCDNLTRIASAMNYAVICPVVLSLDVMERCFIMAMNYLNSPIILRINANHFNLGHFAWFAQYYQNKYPTVPASIMAAHVKEYDEVTLACRHKYNGIALNDDICIDDETKREFIKKCALVCNASNTALQVTVENPEKLFDKNLIDFIVENKITMIRIKLKEKISDENINKYKELFSRIKKTVPVDICLNDMGTVETKYYEEIKWAGVSKFDIFKGASDIATEACLKAYNDDPNKNSRGILPSMRKALFDTYMQELDDRFGKTGNFVNKHVLPPALLK